MERLGEIKAPTLVVGATADEMTPAKYSQFLASRIPGAQLLLVEGAGHMVQLEQPEVVGRRVAEFVAGLE